MTAAGWVEGSARRGIGPGPGSLGSAGGRWLGVRRLIGLGFVAAVVALLGSAAARGSQSPAAASPPPLIAGALVTQHAVAPATAASLRNAGAVERALGFILALQPQGTYILTTPGVDDVVHMDVAHSAIALAKAGHAPAARAALDWLLERMTIPGDPDRYAVGAGDGKLTAVDYAGSWWDHFLASGQPRTDLTRGRAEGVGIALIAAYAVYLDYPDYLAQPIGAGTVADRVALAARYLASPAVQRPDGRFYHRPDYRVSFNEEGARMVLGLQLAAEMLGDAGRDGEARAAQGASDLGLRALLKGKGINQGMPYDYYALGIWGLGGPQQADRELTAMEATGLLTPAGVRSWDWQSEGATGLLDRLRWWASSQAIAPSETFDWAIANVTAGHLEPALQVERQWLALQRGDGGFPEAYVPALGLSLGTPTSYSAARFVLLERLLTEALRGSTLAEGHTGG